MGAADPTGHCPMCVGALIGGGIDFAVQLATNGGDVHKVNWVQVGVSAAVGATGVGLGGVIANATKSVAVNVALNTAASAVVGAVGAEVQNKAQEALTPGRFAPVEPVRAAATGAVTGALGAVVGETAKGLTRGFRSFREANRPVREKLIQNSSALFRDKDAISVYDRMYGIGSFVSTTLSNAGPGLPSKVTDRLPSER